MLALSREATAAQCIPYTAQLNAQVVRTRYLDYVQVFRLAGASFESVDDEQLNNWHERLNVLWRNIAAPGLGLWVHVIRRRAGLCAPGGEGQGFAASLHARYHQRLARERLMVNELYLSLVHRPRAAVAGSLLSRALGAAPASVAETHAALEACDKLAETVTAALARYEPQPLGIYQHAGITCSSLLEFLALLVNGEWQRMPLPRGPINEVLATARLSFGTEALEYRQTTSTQVGAMLGIKEYATPSIVGQFNRLLAAPFAFVLTQSFLFLSRAAAQGLLQRQINRMANAGDFGQSQAAQLRIAQDALSSNEFVMGEHHLSLQVLAELDEQAGSGRALLKPLEDRVAQARSLLAESGMTVAREDLGLEAAFWAQLPGNLPLRPRRAPITSRNFAAMAPFHNYPTGRASGNHWGEALTTLMTSARSPYHFSLHAADPSDEPGGGRRDTGHTFICGPTGSGKTVLIGFLIAMLTRCEATQIVFDKDRGLEILVRALGGEYLPLRNGVPTGFNPLQLADTPADREFLRSWLRTLVSPAHATPPGVRELSELDQALQATLALEFSARRLSRLIEFLDPTNPEGVYARLAPWCARTRGDYAWVFDNPHDSIIQRLPGRALIGFDVTDFLDNGTTRTAVTLYLFHLIRQLLDGRRLVCWLDEFWRLLGDPAFEGFAKDGPKTWRKLNAVMCLATQSPSDVLGSAISRTIIEQTATKVFFPNPTASAEEYMQGFGLSEREWRLIRERLEPASRLFLLKQGHHSVIGQLDLRGFEAELRVISGRASQLERMQQLMRRFGCQPADWLPAFLSA
jgi:type IV secretion system protein VirB4